LESALAAVEGRYDQVLCCGDLVGYGADPNPAVDWVRQHCAGVVRGNHDKACAGLSDASEFNNAARTAARWTFNRLSQENLDYLRDMPQGPLTISANPEEFLLVHGSFTDEDEYLLGENDARPEMERLPVQLTFFGHTHVQGGFVVRGGRTQTLRPPRKSEIDRAVLEIEEREKYLLNPGSIGQPRDGDPRAALVIYTPEERVVEYWRMPYDVAAAQQKILDAGLPEVLATRLKLGR
jgi:predicted phosphodiesterase